MKRILMNAAVVVGILNIWFQAIIWLPQQWARTDYNRDMTIYYYAARNLHNHLPIYHRMTADYGPWSAPDTYLYPPYLAAGLIAFAGRYLVFSRIWYCGMIVLYWIYAALLARLSLGRAGGSDRIALFKAAVVWGVVLAITPGYFSPPSAVYRLMSLGNVDPLLWVLFAWAALAMSSSRENDDERRGSSIGQVCLAVMTLFKPYAALSWLAVICRRGVRTAVPAIVVVIALTIATLLVGGAGPFVDWVKHALPLAAQGAFTPINWSIPFVGLRLLRGLGWWHYATGPLPAGPRLYLTLASIAGPVAVAFLSRRWSVRAQVIALYLAAMLFSPLCWQTYLLAAYVPLAIYVARFAERSEKADAEEPSTAVGAEA